MPFPFSTPSALNHVTTSFLSSSALKWSRTWTTAAWRDSTKASPVWWSSGSPSCLCWRVSRALASEEPQLSAATPSRWETDSTAPGEFHVWLSLGSRAKKRRTHIKDSYISVIFHAMQPVKGFHQTFFGGANILHFKYFMRLLLWCRLLLVLENLHWVPLQVKV